MLKHLFTVLLIAAMVPAYSQTQVDDTGLYDLSLEELMNVKIVSASRLEEKAFDAPLSSYVITGNEIFNSGSTSIPDALRLCPGLFVKEMANGVYDVSIRGMDNLPSHQYININKFILVMINNRPVFDYLNGGTIWQNLPIDIIDVDKIEVVLGPSAPLYGPNAVTGVINIITKGAVKDGVSVVANVQGGTPESLIGQAWVGYAINDKWDVTASVNYNKRDRGTIEFFDVGLGRFITDLDESTNPLIQMDPTYKKLFYPDPELSLEKLGGNVNVSYHPSTDVKLDVAGGLVENTAWYGFSTLGASNYFSNKSAYGMVKGQANGFSFLGSILQGNQKLLGDVENYQYDYTNLDAYLDYNIVVSDKLSLRPAISYQSSTSNDKPYTVEKQLVGIFNNEATMYNYAASLKADYTVGKFRLIGALRGDKFRYPDDLYVSYQGMMNYKIDGRNNIRFVVAKSNSGSFITDTFVSIPTITAPSAANPLTTEVYLKGNKERNLVENHLIEVGYRTKLLTNLQFDISLFRQQAEGFASMVNQAPEVDTANMVMKVNVVTTDLDIEAVQNGLTLAVNWVAYKNRLNFKPFVTLQQTEWKNYSPYYISPEAANATGLPSYSTDSQEDIKSKATPNIYGGFYANFTPHDRWNLNLNGYLMSEYEMFTLSTSEGKQPPYTEFVESYINGKFIMNAKVSYRLTTNINVFASARNAFNKDGREYFATDKIGAMYLGGLHFNW